MKVLRRIRAFVLLFAAVAIVFGFAVLYVPGSSDAAELCCYRVCMLVPPYWCWDECVPCPPFPPEPPPGP